MSCIVSVIIPVFKVEAYLERCVNSVLEQSMDNIEIILVDDGSPDGCAKICEKYGCIFPKVEVIHKLNGGLASARNAGMRIATGKYVFFVDSDDWIDGTCLSDLVDIAERENVDFVRTRGKYANWPNRKDGDVCQFGNEKMMRTGRYSRDHIEEEILPVFIATSRISFGPIVSAWGTLYNTSLLKDNEIEFFEDIRYSEDAIFNSRVVMCADAFYYLNEPQYYNYFYNSTSITKSFHHDIWQSNKNNIHHFEDVFKEYQAWNIPMQLWYRRLFCILDAIGESALIPDYKERIMFLRNICNDPITSEAMQHLEELDVSWKLWLILLLIKFRQIHLLAILYGYRK